MTTVDIADQARTASDDAPYVWCVVANVASEPLPQGPKGELVMGTKHFAPGTKLYCNPLLWGDGGERIRVLGRHRAGGPRLIEIVVGTKWLTNFRAAKVYHPHVVNVMSRQATDPDAHRVVAEEMAAYFAARCSATPYPSDPR